MPSPNDNQKIDAALPKCIRQSLFLPLLGGLLYRYCASTQDFPKTFVHPPITPGQYASSRPVDSASSQISWAQPFAK